MIVLLTDFGFTEYVGAMKGVIKQSAADAEILDFCHSVQPHCVIEGAWLLKKNYRYFPAGSVFCSVVDPGVGGRRRALAVKAGEYYFVGPDNGLLWEAVTDAGIEQVRELAVPADSSRTFQGRDVFAKAAAEIDSGVFESVGEVIEGLERLEIYKQGRQGTVVRIDSFGNIVTNIESAGRDDYMVTIRGRMLQMRFRESYEFAKEGELFVIEGSAGTLEISVKEKRAQDRLRLEAGERIKIA